MIEKVYALLREIPIGKVVTYQELAIRLGDKHLARAVGNALHNNKDGDYYPCYKAVDSKGRLSENYAFGGLISQKERLRKDGIEVKNSKVDLLKYGFKFLNELDNWRQFYLS